MAGQPADPGLVGWPAGREIADQKMYENVFLCPIMNVGVAPVFDMEFGVVLLAPCPLA